jgi:hypothetical protein
VCGGDFEAVVVGEDAQRRYLESRGGMTDGAVRVYAAASFKLNTKSVKALKQNQVMS